LIVIFFEENVFCYFYYQHLSGHCVKLHANL